MSERTKIYIAGKITGDDNYKDKFKRAERQLNKKGYAVLSPAMLPKGMSPDDYMAICISMISRADVVYFLDDYKKSKGAKIEYSYAKYCGKEIIVEEKKAQKEKEMEKSLNCLCCGKKLSGNRKKFCNVECRNESASIKKITSGTLCWNCENTNDSCSYFGSDQIPVEGWEARRGKAGGYNVRRCPQFRLTKRLEKYAHIFDRDGFKKCDR